MIPKRLCFLYILIFTTVSAYAQNMDEIFHWTVSPQSALTAPGETFILEATLSVKENHIVYQDMTSFSIENAENITLGEVVLPEAKEKTDPTDNEIKKVYAGTELFKIPFTADPALASGTKEFQLIIKYQGCSEKLCYFPQTLAIPISLQIKPATSTSIPAASNQAVQSPTAPASLQKEDLQNRLSHGGFLTFLFIFFMGFLTSLTPCVYPLIPITVSIFGAKETKSKIQAFSLASVYVLGIAVMYSSLGFFAAKTGTIFGQFMSNPIIVSIIALLFVAMGISMLGAFDLRLPTNLQNRLSMVGGKGYISAFLMGLVAGVVAAPCTGPVLAAILAHVTYSGNVFYGVSLLFVYSLGLGSLFLIIGTYSGLISKLPKSGKWMESIKSIFAIIMFVSALYFLGNAFEIFKKLTAHDPVIYTVLFILLWISIFKLGAIHLSIHSNPMIRNKKITGIIICTLSFYGIFTTSMAPKQSSVSWKYNLEESLTLAKIENKPVMIDFYADWCTVCKELDALTYSDEDAGKALERFICIKVDIDAKTVDKNKLIKEYNIPGLPLVVFIDSKGTRLDQKRIDGFIKPDLLIKHIQDIH